MTTLAGPLYTNAVSGVTGPVETIGIVGTALKGQWVCMATATDAKKVIIATKTNLDAAGVTRGIAVKDSFGGQVLIADDTAVVDTTVSLLSSGGYVVPHPTTAFSLLVNRADGSEYIGGNADTSGNVTVKNYSRRGVSGTSPRHVYNVAAYGAVADASLLYGLKLGDPTHVATDNTPFIMAAYNAIQASGAGGDIYFPACPPGGAYYCATPLNFTGAYPVRLFGDQGDGFGSGYPPATLVFAASNPLNGDRTTPACIIENGSSTGWAIEYLGIIKPVAQQVVPWTAGQSVNNLLLVPSKGTYGVIYLGPASFINVGSPEHTFPTDFDIDTYYKVGDKIYVTGIVDALNPSSKPWRYVVTAVAGTQKTTDQEGFVPYAGSAPLYDATHVYAVGEQVRPANADWTGKYYTCTTATGVAAGTKPAWSATTGADNVSGGGTHFSTSAVPLWARATGLDVVSNNVTFQLDSTTGLEHDANAGGTGGAFDWTVLTPVPGLQAYVAGEMLNMHLEQHEDGIQYLGGGGAPADGWYGYRCSIINTANNAVYCVGADSNVGVFDQLNISGWGNCAIRADSFLGSRYNDAIITGGVYSGRYSCRATGVNGAQTFDGIYTEGGSPPHWLRNPSVFINAKGSPSFKNGVAEVPTWSGFTTNTPFALTSGPMGHPWQALHFYQVGDNVYPTPSNTKAYKVTATTGDATSGASQPAGFAATTTTGATFTETTGSGSVTYQCSGPDTATITSGNDIFPQIASTIKYADVALDFNPWMDNVPSDGFIGCTFNEQANQCFFSLEVSTLRLWLGLLPVYFGYGAARKLWDWQAAAAIPAIAHAVGDIVWNSSAAPGTGAAEYCTTAANPGTFSHAAKVYTDDEEQFKARQLRRTGGTDVVDGTALPEAIAPRRLARTVINAGTVVLDEVTIPDGSVCTVKYKYWVKQIAGTGNPKGAVGKATIAARRAGTVLTIEDAAVVTPGSANELSNAFSFDTSSPPDIAFKFAAGDATKTFLIGAECTVSGIPSADAELGALQIDQGASITIVEGSSEIFGASGGTPPYTWTIPTNVATSTIVSAGGAGTYTAGTAGGFKPDDVVRVTDAVGATANITVHVWNPSRLPNLLFWHRADLGATVSGGAISALADQSGGGYTLTASGGNPTYNAADAALNNQASVQTDGTTSLQNTGFTQALPFSFFWFGTTSDTANNYVYAFSLSTWMFSNNTPKGVINNGASLVGGSAISTKSSVLGCFGSTTANSYIAVNNWVTGGTTGNAGVVGGAVGIGVGKASNFFGFKAATHFAEGAAVSGLNTAIAASDLTYMQTYASNRYGIAVT
jgi:hypothetical protein